MKRISIGIAILGCFSWFTATASQADLDAEKLFRMPGFQGGLVVHVGCSDGRLTAALRRDERCLAQGLEDDPSSPGNSRLSGSRSRSLRLRSPSIPARDNRPVPSVGKSLLIAALPHTGGTPRKHFRHAAFSA